MTLDVIELKIFKPPISKAKRKTRKNICKRYFLNEGVELVNVPRIFHDPSVKACLPTDIKFYNPTVLSSLTNLISSRMFNFRMKL